jgi:hypothetical protein
MAAQFVAPAVGFIAGPLQLGVLFRRLTDWGRWVLASIAAGIATPLVLGLSGVTRFIDTSPGGCTPSGPGIDPWLSGAIAGGMIGVVFGIAQMVVLRRESALAFWWPVLSVIAWTVPFTMLEYSVNESLVLIVIVACMPGLLQSLGMAWILQRRPGA